VAFFTSLFNSFLSLLGFGGGVDGLTGGGGWFDLQSPIDR
jgi:hypothetical protein